MKRALLSFWIVLFLTGSFLYAQSVQGEERANIAYRGSRNYELVERTDLRCYDNGKYIGLTSREVRSFIINKGELYDGFFYVLQQTKHDARKVNRGINDSIPSVFTIDEDGDLCMIEDNGFPSFRSFPAFTVHEVKKGESWHASASRAVDPLEKGIFTILPMYVEYTYTGDSVTESGEEVFVLTAKWATRYGGSVWDDGGDPSLVSAQGSHSATMHVSKETGCALVVRDSVDEQFTYANGTTVRFKGTISLFTKYPPAIDRSKIFPALERRGILTSEESESFISGWLPSSGGGSSSGSSSSGTSSSKPKVSVTGKKGISVSDTDSGLMLTMQNLRFKPDSAELLAEEKERLDDIAEILKEVPGSLFLVEGHTASTGNPSGEKTLSLERAHAIVNALVARGIPLEQFICRGSGSSKPVASNSTPEGMAQNRRVEITILE